MAGPDVCSIQAQYLEHILVATKGAAECGHRILPNVLFNMTKEAEQMCFHYLVSVFSTVPFRFVFPAVCFRLAFVQCSHIAPVVRPLPFLFLISKLSVSTVSLVASLSPSLAREHPQSLAHPLSQFLHARSPTRQHARSSTPAHARMNTW